MCMAALPLLSMGLGIAQAGVGYNTAVNNANAQNAAWQQNFNNSIKAQEDRYASINNNTRQEKASSDQQLMEKRIEGMRAMATARNAAGESGVTGLSTSALLGDYAARMGRQEDAIAQNYENKRDHNADELVSTNDNTIARINSVQRAQRVSAAPFIFQALGGVMGGLTMGNNMAIKSGGVGIDG